MNKIQSPSACSMVADLIRYHAMIPDYSGAEVNSLFIPYDELKTALRASTIMEFLSKDILDELDPGSLPANKDEEVESLEYRYDMKNVFTKCLDSHMPGGSHSANFYFGDYHDIASLIQRVYRLILPISKYVEHQLMKSACTYMYDITSTAMDPDIRLAASLLARAEYHLNPAIEVEESGSNRYYGINIPMYIGAEQIKPRLYDYMNILEDVTRWILKDVQIHDIESILSGDAIKYCLSLYLMPSTRGSISKYSDAIQYMLRIYYKIIGLQRRCS